MTLRSRSRTLAKTSGAQAGLVETTQVNDGDQARPTAAAADHVKLKVLKSLAFAGSPNGTPGAFADDKQKRAN